MRWSLFERSEGGRSSNTFCFLLRTSASGPQHLAICLYNGREHAIMRHAFMAELIPYARLEVIAEAGHLPTLEAPEATTAALRAWMQQPFVLQ